MRLGVVFLLWILNANAQVAVRDDYGNEVRLVRPAARIVSLAPHLAELVYAAGAGSRLVGAVEFSDFPPQRAPCPSWGAMRASTSRRSSRCGRT